MKYNHLLFVVAYTTTMFLTATLFAAPSENRDPAARKAEILKKFDKDGDGKLSDTEKKTLQAEMQNRQGGHDRKQWTPEQRNEMLKKFDKDSDGKLSDTEKASLRSEMQSRRGGRDRKQWTPEQRNEMLKKFDKDGNGELSDDERAAVREAMRPSRTKSTKQGST